MLPTVVPLTLAKKRPAAARVPLTFQRPLRPVLSLPTIRFGAFLYRMTLRPSLQAAADDLTFPWKGEWCLMVTRVKALVGPATLALPVAVSVPGIGVVPGGQVEVDGVPEITTTWGAEPSMVNLLFPGFGGLSFSSAIADHE